MLACRRCREGRGLAEASLARAVNSYAGRGVVTARSAFGPALSALPREIATESGGEVRAGGRGLVRLLLASTAEEAAQPTFVILIATPSPI